MSSREIEDVLASIRRLVSGDLRPANRPGAVGKLLLTPALRVVMPAGLVDAADARSDRAAQAGAGPAASNGSPSRLRDNWLPDQSSLAAVADHDADHLDIAGAVADPAAAARAPAMRSALQSAAEAFHAQADEFILSYGDSGAFVLRDDSAPASAASPPQSDHGAVFAVLTRAQAGVRTAPVQALEDAEGGAPVEDEAQWTTLDWQDQPAAESAAPHRNAASAGTAPTPAAAGILHEPLSTDGPPEVPPFVSARRPLGGSGAELLTLRSPLMPLTQTVAGAVKPGMPAAPLILRSTGTPDQAPRAAPSAAQPDPVGSRQGDGADAAAVAQTDAAPLQDMVPSAPPAAPSVHDPMPDAAMQAIDTSALTLKTAEARTKAPPRLAEAAFTRWPGWPQPEQKAPASAAPPPVAAAPVPRPADVTPRKKPKAAVQDLGWADRAEAEIHRRLAVELGTSPIRDASPQTAGLQLSEAALRDLVRDMIREELTGQLGERITQSLRKLVQMELQKSMSLQTGEFRTQRRQP